jgi:zinc transporter ZupT
MRFNKLNNRFRWGIIGGFLGGLIAIIGFWILSPPTDSIVLFVILRVIVGSVVAMIIAPILTTRLIKDKSK